VQAYQLVSLVADYDPYDNSTFVSP